MSCLVLSVKPPEVVLQYFVSDIQFSSILHDSHLRKGQTLLYYQENPSANSFVSAVFPSQQIFSSFNITDNIAAAMHSFRLSRIDGERTNPTRTHLPRRVIRKRNIHPTYDNDSSDDRILDTLLVLVRDIHKFQVDQMNCRCTNCWLINIFKLISKL